MGPKAASSVRPFKMRRRVRQRNGSEKTRAGISCLCERPIPMDHTTRATPRAPESTKIAHLAASFRRARHGSATPNPPLRVEKRTSATATTARKRHRRFGRKRGKNAGFAVGWSRAALVGPSPTLACSRTLSLAFSHRSRFRSRDMKRISD